MEMNNLDWGWSMARLMLRESHSLPISSTKCLPRGLQDFYLFQISNDMWVGVWFEQHERERERLIFELVLSLYVIPKRALWELEMNRIICYDPIQILQTIYKQLWVVKPLIKPTIQTTQLDTNIFKRPLLTFRSQHLRGPRGSTCMSLKVWELGV